GRLSFDNLFFKERPMPQDLSQELMEQLLAADSPTIANAIELYERQSRWAGYVGPEIQCRFPDLGRAMGYAVTCTIREVDESNPPDPEERMKWLEAIEKSPKPVICVVQDKVVGKKGLAAHWGEIMGTMVQQLGTVGIVTDGAVRDLEALHAIGMKVWSEHVVVSHGWIDVDRADIPVDIGGLTINPGDILHADCNGVVAIPPEILEDIPEVIDRLKERKKEDLEKMWKEAEDRASLKKEIKH
ncbi:MAG: RraA family protein, partial [Candidatus Omnitrophica bacterium]|nr:RraA family protein [Candidatus Omnitrophota bacterium]